MKTRRAAKTARRRTKVEDLPVKVAKGRQERRITGGAVYQHNQTDLEFI